MYTMKTYTLSATVYLDKHHKCYKKIVTINKKPKGSLGKHVRRMHYNKISPFKESTPCNEIKNCFFALTDFDDKHRLLTVDKIPHLFSYLMEHDYKIDTKITKMMNQSKVQLDPDLICFISKEDD